MMRPRSSYERVLPILIAGGGLITALPAHASSQPDGDGSASASAQLGATADASADADAGADADAETETETERASETSADAESSSSAGGAAASASAAAATSGARRFRLHADTEFFGFTHIDDEPDHGSMTADDVNVIGFGFGRSGAGDSGLCSGIGGFVGTCVLSVRPVWGLGFGFAFANQRAVVGARFSFTVDGIFDDDDTDDDHTNLVAGQFVPYFRWIFRPGTVVRPYIEARFGLGGGALISNDPDGGPMMEHERTTLSVIYPTIGAGGGVHIFLIDALSLDFGLNADYFAPHTRLSIDPDPADVSQDYDHDTNVASLGVLAGFSVWIP